MAKLTYKARIHKNKLSFRNLRYAAADQLVRWFPPLGRRWLFPVEAVRMPEAAESALAYETIRIDTEPPPTIRRLVKAPLPLASVQKVYGFRDTVIVGQSGALIQNGKLLAVRANPNWAVSLRPRRYEMRTLHPQQLHYALMPPVPAIGHVFHWLLDYVSPFMTWLELREDKEPVSPIVNGVMTEFQRRTLDFLVAHYRLLPPVGLGANEAAHAGRIAVSVLEPYAPRAMQTHAGIEAMKRLGEFLSEGRASETEKRRLYISRNDAKLRRVINEENIEPLLKRYGFEIVVLKGKPIAEQVRLFQEADAVLAPHGAGLTHIVWSKPGTKVIEFFPSREGPRGAPRNATGNFWILSCQKGLDYHTFDAGPPLNRHDGFKIPEALLAETLAKHFG